MIREEICQIKSGKKELRKYGLVFSLVMFILGGISFYKGRAGYCYFFPASFIFLILAVLRPLWLRLLHKIMASILIVVVAFITNIVLIFVFYGVITPMGIVARLLGKDFLNLKFKDGKESYWDEVSEDKKNYQHQF